MNRALRILLIMIVIASIGYYIVYRGWYRMEAMVWHWRYGHSTTLGEYVVPVPDDWLVQRHGDLQLIDLVDTHVNKDAGPFAEVSVISVDLASSSVRDLSYWQSLKRQSLEREGLTDLEERTLRVGGDTVVCLGGYELRQDLKVPSVNALSLECTSTGRLNLMFLGPRSSLTDFYTIVSGIHKRTSG